LPSLYVEGTELVQPNTLGIKKQHSRNDEVCMPYMKADSLKEELLSEGTFTGSRAEHYWRLAHATYHPGHMQVREASLSWEVVFHDEGSNLRVIGDLKRDGMLDVIELGFRGTVTSGANDLADLQNWLANLDARAELMRPELDHRDSNCDKTIEIHRGFQNAYLSLRKSVHEWLHGKTHREREALVHLCGHSLGGALATLAAIDLQGSGWLVQAVVTFGAPRVGNSAFANMYRALGLSKCTARFTNKSDPVPWVPLTSQGFEHVTEAIELGAGSSSVVRTAIEQARAHSIVQGELSYHRTLRNRIDAKRDQSITMLRFLEQHRKVFTGALRMAAKTQIPYAGVLDMAAQVLQNDSQQESIDVYKPVPDPYENMLELRQEITDEIASAVTSAAVAVQNIAISSIEYECALDLKEHCKMIWNNLEHLHEGGFESWAGDLQRFWYKVFEATVQEASRDHGSARVLRLAVLLLETARIELKALYFHMDHFPGLAARRPGQMLRDVVTLLGHCASSCGDSSLSSALSNLLPMLPARQLLFSDCNGEAMPMLTEAGVIPLLVGSIGALRVASEQEQALDALKSVFQRSERHREMICEAGVIQLLVTFLRDESTPALRQRAIALLDDLSLYSGDAIRDAGAIPSLLRFLRTDSPPSEREVALCLLSNLLEKNVGNQVAVREAGGIPLIVEFLQDCHGPIVREKAVAAMRNLSLQNSATRDAICQSGAVPLLVQVLSLRCYGDCVLHEREMAAGVLRTLSAGSNASAEAIREAIREAGGIPVLVQLLKANCTASERTAAAATLSDLAEGNPANAEVISQAGAIPLLIVMLGQNSTSDQQLVAVAVLGALSETSNADAIRQAGAIPSMVKLLDSKSREGVAAALLRLSVENSCNKDAICEAGGIPLLVKLLHDTCTSSERTVAAALLESLAEESATNAEMIRKAGALPLLDQILQSNCMPDELEVAAALLRALSTQSIHD